MKHLRHRKALVTGAASGIGLAIAEALAAEGVNLWLVDINADALHRAADALGAHGVEVITDGCDLADAAQVDALVERIAQRWASLHILVNNAAVGYYGSTWAMTAAQWEHMLAVNLHAPIQLIRLLLPMLSAQDEAQIVNISSILGLTTYRKTAAYQTTKYALVGLSEALRIEYAGTNLGVSVICPGFVRDTGFYDAMTKPDPMLAHRRPPAWLCCVPQKIAKRTVNAIRRNRGLTVVTQCPPIMWWVRRLSPWFADKLYQVGYGFGRRRRARRRKQNAS